MLQEQLKKFSLGDPLTDQDCKDLHKFFLAMEDGCNTLGREFHLFESRMRTDRYAIESYIAARKL